ncbi:MAG: EAL domain-containing protein, partial [Acetobacteraceae bacterium]|nr:EAL domain-containing protein [Acetobacteraceae bacterium]
LAVAAGHFPGKTAGQAYAGLRGEVAQLTARGHQHELAGSDRVVAVHYRPMANGGWVATYEDVTERQRSEERLWQMARHDALTGLPNRVRLREHMESLLLRLRRGGSAAVLCLDLDGFKRVNDALGHPAGDELLRQVARRLGENTRETDLVARLGGDEFAIVQADAEQPTEAAALAERLVEVLREPFSLSGQQRVEIGTSIGIMLAEAASTPDDLLRSADIALYQAKAAGRGTWRFFELGMDAEMQARRTLETDLKRALVEQQFELHYQPLVEAETRVLTGFEALVRWRHPERGMVSPAKFVPLAEETGLIRPIGEWVLRRACADAVAWPEHVKVAVNLSPMQFAKGDLVGDVERALVDSGLAPDRLELEITESVLLADNEATLGTLHRLRSLGVRISMDDFGTGYSSLSYLRRFPFDKIKIDQSFVRNLDGEKGSVEIVRAVVSLGKALGMDVLAEGVETEGQLGILQLEGCDELQGYLFSKPRPVQDVPAVIARHAPGQAGGSLHGPTLVVDNIGEGQQAA